MISEQLNAVVAQMKLLSQRQDRLENAAGVSASHVFEPPLGAASKLPPISAGLRHPSGVPQTVAAKALQLLGPPPKVRTSSPVEDVTGAVPEEPYDVLQPSLEDLRPSQFWWHTWRHKAETRWEIWHPSLHLRVQKACKGERRCRTN